MSDPIADRKMTDEQNIAQLLRQWAEAINLPSGPFVKEDLIYAADTIAKLSEDVDCYETLFDAAWEADMLGVKMWREAHPGNDLVLPDRANFTSWILTEIMRLRFLTISQETLIRKAEAESEKLRSALLVAHKYVLVQSCELSLMPEDAARDLAIIDGALEEGCND